MRLTVAMAAACLSVVGLAAGPDARAVMRNFELNIPRQTLDSALRDLAQQTGLQIALFADTVDGNVVVGPIQGTHSAEDALQTLLAPSGLSYKVVSEGTVAVLKAGSETPPRATPAPAATDQQVRLEEVVVTAQKREERLRDVPISIVALDSKDLRERVVTSLDDLAGVVPGLTVQDNGGFQRRIVLRGISNIYGNSSLIGMYLNEASVTAEPTMQLDLRTYDLERVEVLRGPQGTLYGDGSVGGTIRFITRQPSLDQFELNTRAAAEFTQNGSPGQRIEGALNLPLVSEQLGLRVAGTFDHQGGWVDQPLAGRDDFNSQNLADVRATGLWKPNDRLAATAMVVVHRNDAPPPNGEDARGNFRQVFNQAITPHAEDDYELYNLTATYDLGSMQLLNTTSYLDQSKDVGYSLHFPAFGAEALIPNSPRSARIFSDELRLTSSGDSPLRWTLGGFYRKARFTSALLGYYFGAPNAPGDPLPPPALDFADLRQFESWAAFGDASYRFGLLTLGAGVRYFDEHQRYASGVPAALGPEAAGDFHATTPRVYAQLRLSNDLMLYASAANGFRSGGFNSQGPATYGPEDLWTYEMGAKLALFENRVSADVALFFSDYGDIQVNGVPLTGPPIGITSNAGKAELRGIEWTLAWSPVEHWSFDLNGYYIDSEFTKINLAATSHAVGDQLDLSPPYSFTVSARRDFHLNERKGYVRLDYDQVGRASYRNRSFSPTYFSESDVINMLALNVSIDWTPSLTLGVFARNLLNDRGYADPFSIEDYATRVRPRTYGVEFGFSFD